MKAKQATRLYAADNEQAAQIITRDPARYPAGSLAQQWALAYMARIERDNVARIGPLFAAADRRRAA